MSKNRSGSLARLLHVRSNEQATWTRQMESDAAVVLWQQNHEAWRVIDNGKFGQNETYAASERIHTTSPSMGGPRQSSCTTPARNA